MERQEVEKEYNIKLERSLITSQYQQLSIIRNVYIRRFCDKSSKYCPDIFFDSINIIMDVDKTYNTIDYVNICFTTYCFWINFEIDIIKEMEIQPKCEEIEKTIKNQGFMGSVKKFLIFWFRDGYLLIRKWIEKDIIRGSSKSQLSYPAPF